MKIIYQQEAFDKTVDFIATHNPSFINDHKYIASRIYDVMWRLIQKFPDGEYISTMGFHITSECSCEGISGDEDEIYFGFLVDPIVGSNREDDWLRLDIDPEEGSPWIQK